MDGRGFQRGNFSKTAGWNFLFHGTFRPGVLFSLLAFLGSPQFALGNDTSVTLGAGGLKMEKNEKVRIRSEKLFLSTEKIRVDYEMENISSEPVETLVAFPMPKQSGAELVNEPVVLEHRDRENFVDFTVEVDGVKISPELESRAFLLEDPNKEVTADLQALGLLVSPVREDFYRLLERLPAERQKDLEDRKILEIYRSERQDPTFTPLWELRTSYYWKQLFPPGKILHVHHEYHPVVGHGFFSKNTIADERKRWCIDSSTAAGIEKRLRSTKKYEDSERLLSRLQVDYVLSSGANWSGPILDFELLIEKSRPQELISLCMSGLEKVNDRQFRLKKKDFTPSSDLSVLFIAPFPPSVSAP